jgi:hypothetical protein
MAKGMAGTWKCTGKDTDPKDPTKVTEMTGTMTSKLDMDKWFVRGDWTGKSTMGNAHGTFYTTYDSTQKKWFRFGMDSMGGTEYSSSSGMQGTKMVWEGEMRSSMMPSTIKMRTTEDIGAKEVKISSEALVDGKSYKQVFEMTCKK